MGQKSHPIGLRLGIHRKWNTTWFAEKNNYKISFFAQHQVEQILKAFFYFYSYTKNSSTKRLLLVDLKWYRAGFFQMYLFVFFYKFYSKKRRKVIKRRKAKKKFNFVNKNAVKKKHTLQKN